MKILSRRALSAAGFFATLGLVASPSWTQERVRVVQEFEILEKAPPKNLPRLLSETDEVVLVRVDGAKSTLNSKGQVVRRYEATVLETLSSKGRFETADEIAIDVRGGAVFNGRLIRRGEQKTFVELVLGQQYVVFLRHTPVDHTVVWGKYGTFQVLYNRVLPATELGHPFLSEFGGLRFEDFRAEVRALTDPQRKKGGDRP